MLAYDKLAFFMDTCHLYSCGILLAYNNCKYIINKKNTDNGIKNSTSFR